MLNLDQVLRIDKRTASRILFGEAVVLTPMYSKVFTFNETASRIWELLDGEPTVGEIVARLHREFQVSEEQARTDVESFVETLIARGLIILGRADSKGEADGPNGNSR